jgi:molybdopterin-guanine dinucleotide biosynthesis protein A
VAGGASSRFNGVAKGLLHVGGLRIIDRVAEALRTVAPNIMIVSNAPESASWLPGVPVYPDVGTERGSLVAIRTALTAARGSVLVVAWDMPFVDTELLALLARRFEGATYAAIPEGISGLEPFCAAYTPACLPLVDAALDRGDFRMRSFLAALPSVATVSAAEVAAIGDPSRLFFNVNEPADLLAAERLAGG